MLCCGLEVSAQKNTVQQIDAEVIAVHQTDFLLSEGQTGWIGLDECDYVFTNKSAGKIIPLQVETDGVMWYCFSSDKVELLDENKRVLLGRTDDEKLRYAFVRGTNTEYSVDREPIRLLPVKKESTYYVRFPDTFTEEKYGAFAYVFPQNVKEILCRSGKKFINKGGYDGSITYLSEGTGKYTYYPFSIKRKSMAMAYLYPMFTDDIEDKAYFRVQKKIKGKWKNITSVRKSYANYQHEGNSLYGFSKGKYRLGVKAKKGQIVAICAIRTCDMNDKKAVKKSRALLIKKGKKKEGMFVWENTKAHWYKVVKTSKNKVKKIELQTGTVTDKTRFTIYKEGQKAPLKKLCFQGRDRAGFKDYRSKIYTLNDEGIYYIKVSKANKKTNGGYRIRVK